VRYLLENDLLSSRPVDEKLQFLEYSPCISSNVVNDKEEMCDLVRCGSCFICIVHMRLRAW